MARDYLDTPSLDLLAHCLHHTAKNLSVEQLARMLGVHKRALQYRESRAGLPSPRRIMAWCRALHAAELLERTGLSRSMIAAATGYCSADAMRKSLHRLGLAGRLLRRKGGLDHAAMALLEELRLKR
jgi:transcriptional regulator GlxA family with amidase domain